MLQYFQAIRQEIIIHYLTLWKSTGYIVLLYALKKLTEFTIFNANFFISENERYCHKY